MMKILITTCLALACLACSRAPLSIRTPEELDACISATGVQLIATQWQEQAISLRIPSDWVVAQSSDKRVFLRHRETPQQLPCLSIGIVDNYTQSERDREEATFEEMSYTQCAGITVTSFLARHPDDTSDEKMYAHVATNTIDGKNILFFARYYESYEALTPEVFMAIVRDTKKKGSNKALDGTSQ